MPYREFVPDTVFRKLNQLPKNKYANLVRTFKTEYLLDIKYVGKNQNLVVSGTNKTIVAIGLDELKASVGLSCRLQLCPRLEASGRVLWHFRGLHGSIIPKLFKGDVNRILNVPSIRVGKFYEREIYEIECHQRDFDKVNPVIQDIEAKIQNLNSAEIPFDENQGPPWQRFKRKFRRHPLFHASLEGPMTAKKYGERDQSTIQKTSGQLVIRALESRHVELGTKRWEEFLAKGMR